MHVAPIDLRAVRQDGITLRFAMLGSMAYVLGEVPETGSTGTSMERPCTQAHWGMVVEGEITFITRRRRVVIPAGRVFHVPDGGPEHHFIATGSALVAGFQPIETTIDVSEAHLVTQGYEIIPEAPTAPIVPPIARSRIAAGEVSGEAWRMGQFVMCRVRMGERSGYTAGWCDAPHWGIVTDGRLTIEWEDDVEVLSKGDVFHCPGGPPGHRLEAADPATFVDLTPASELDADGRLAEWRRSISIDAQKNPRGIAVAALG